MPIATTVVRRDTQVVHLAHNKARDIVIGLTIGGIISHPAVVAARRPLQARWWLQEDVGDKVQEPVVSIGRHSIVVFCYMNDEFDSSLAIERNRSTTFNKSLASSSHL